MREGSTPPTCTVSHVICHVSHVTCHMSDVMCHMSHVCFQRGRHCLVLTQSISSSITKPPGTFTAAEAAYSGGQVTGDRLLVTHTI